MTRSSIAFFVAKGHATIVVVSNLSSNDEPVPFLDSGGSRLADGMAATVGTFGERTDAQVEAAARSGITSLLAAFRPFGKPLTIGSGADGRAGTIEASATEPTNDSHAATGKALYLVAGNAATLETSTEALLLKFTCVIPTDFDGGLESFASGHAREASVVFGSRSDEGFQTAPFSSEPPVSFASWIAENLPDAPASDRLADSDPDGDGDSNLQEYALGTDPDDRSSKANLDIVTDGDEIFAVYRRRSDDPALSYTLEGSASDFDSWEALEGTTEPASVSAPPRFEAVRHLLPRSDEFYARLRFGYDEGG